MARKAPYFISIRAYAFRSDGELFVSCSVFVYKRGRNGARDELLDICINSNKYAAARRWAMKSNPDGYLYSFELADIVMHDAQMAMKLAGVLGKKVEGPSGSGDLARIRAMIDSAMADPDSDAVFSWEAA